MSPISRIEFKREGGEETGGVKEPAQGNSFTKGNEVNEGKCKPLISRISRIGFEQEVAEGTEGINKRHGNFFTKGNEVNEAKNLNR
jgi:hypothetical protein